MDGLFGEIEDEVGLIGRAFATATQKLRDGRDKLREEKEAAQENKRRIEKELDDAREALDHQRAQYAASIRRLSTISGERIMKINVGGTIYETNVDTLTTLPDSMLGAMFSGKFKVDTLEDGACFLDRDPDLFRDVLAYLRRHRQGIVEGSTFTDHDVVAWAEDANFSPQRRGLLGKEAQYFGLDQMARILLKRTIVVSLLPEDDGPECFRRVSDALITARAGDKIIVKPGVYWDSFLLTKPVHIEGVGASREEVIIRSPCGNVVESRAAEGSLRNLVIEGNAVLNFAPPNGALPVCHHAVMLGDYYCILVTSGALLVENCEIRHAGLSCVKIMGGYPDSVDHAMPTFRNNYIHSAVQCGILITNRAKGVISDNVIHENKFSGIEIRNGSLPEVRRNLIRHNRQNGVYIHSEGGGILAENEIHSNSFNGINVEGKAIVRKNIVTHNAKRGIYHNTETELAENETKNNVLGDVAQKK